MRLVDLEPEFLKITDEGHRTDATMAEADGLMLLCPKCFQKNSGPVGTHRIVCWRPHVPLAPHLTGPGRWQMHGSGFHDLTLTASSNSILLLGGCNAHFFITNGEIINC